MRYIGTVLAKELREVSKRRRTFVLRVAVASVLLLIILPTLISLTRESLRYTSNMAENGRVLFFILSYIVLAVGFFLTPAYCAPLITSEREQQTIEIIISTPIRLYEIILGKIASRVLLLILITISALPIMFICLMFGGVSLLEISMTFCVILCNIFICAGTAIFVSVIANNSISAIARTYSLLLLMGLASIFSMTAFFTFARTTPSIYQKICCFLFISMNPYFMLADLSVGFGFVLSARQMLYGMTADAGFFVLCIILSSLALRRTVYREKKSSRFKDFFSGKRRQTAGTRMSSIINIGRLWGNAVYWKECIESVLSRPSARFRSFLLVFVPVLSLYIISFSLKPSIWINDNSGMYFYGDDRPLLHMPLIVGELGMAFFTMLALSTSSFAKERSKKTLDALILTPLEDRAIWLGKFLGVWRRVILLLAVPFLHLGLCVIHRVFPFHSWWLTLLNMAVLFLFFMTLGIGFSIRCRKRASAIMMTLLVASVAFVWLPVFASMTMALSRYGRNGVGLMIYSLSPWYWLGVPFTYERFHSQYRDTFDFGIGYAGFVAVYLCISAIFAVVFARNLRERIKME